MEYGHRNPTAIVPLGYKFCPYDFELIQILKNKLMNSVVPLGLYNPFVEVDIYSYNPQDLVGMHAQLVLEKNQESWYFFTPRERKYQNGKRPQRKAKDGYWKSVAKDTEIVHNGHIIGFKRVLDFYSTVTGDHSKGTRTDWKMHEYLTKEQKFDQQDDHPSTTQTPMMLNDCILCKIYINRRNKKRKNRDDDEQESTLNNVRMKKLLMVQPADQSVQFDGTEVNYMNDQPQEQEHGAIFIPNHDDNSNEIDYQFSDENPQDYISCITNDVMNYGIDGINNFGLPNQTNNILSEYSWSAYMENQITDLMIGDEVLLTTETELMALPPLEDEPNKQVDDEWFKSIYMENQIIDLTIDDEIVTTGTEHMALPPLEDDQLNKQVDADDDEWLQALKSDLQS